VRNKLRLAVAIFCATFLAVSCATAPAAKPAVTPAPSTASAAPAAELQPIAWSDEAKAAFEAEVPAMVKKIARKSMEKKARERGLTLIDMAFYSEIKKEQMGQ
jgi:hypothetical protein